MCRLSSNTSGSSKSSSSSKIAGVVPDGPLANGNGSYSASATAARGGKAHSRCAWAAVRRRGPAPAVWLGRDDGAAAARRHHSRRTSVVLFRAGPHFCCCYCCLLPLLLLLDFPGRARPSRRRIAASRRHCNLAHKWKMASSIQQRISFSILHKTAPSLPASTPMPPLPRPFIMHPEAACSIRPSSMKKIDPPCFCYPTTIYPCI